VGWGWLSREILHVLLFNTSRKKAQEAQRLLVRILNQQHVLANLRAADARQEPRSNVTVPLVVLPCVGDRPQLDEAFAATTRDLSAAGVGLVALRPLGCEQAILGFSTDEETFFIRVKVRHEEPIAGGFHQIGTSAVEVVHAGDYPGLETMRL